VSFGIFFEIPLISLSPLKCPGNSRRTH